MATLARYEAFALDNAGNVLASPTVEVRVESSGLLAVIFSDRAGASGLANPFTGGSDGLIAFHVAGGAYKIIITSGATVRTLRYVAIGTGGEIDQTTAWPGGATITEASLVLSDVTTDDVSISQHGFAPKAPNDISKFLNGLGAYSSPPFTGAWVDVTAGAAADYKTIGDAAMTTGSTTLTSATANFVSGDVGKYIAVAGAGAAGVTLFTTIASRSSATTIVLNNANASGGNISAKRIEYGTDDATVINANIAAAYALRKNGYFPSAKTCFVSRLNLTGMFGFRLTGSGVGQAQIFPLKVASYGTANGHLIDLTGSLYVQIDNLQIGANYTLAIPTTGVCMLQVASNASNRITLGPNLYISGMFSAAAIYNYGVPSSISIGCDAYNYSPGAGGKNVLTFSASNAAAFTSSFATVTSGTKSTSDWTFFNCEFHKFTGAGGDNAIILFDSCANISFFGGVISGGASEYVQFTGANGSFSFCNVTMETESEPVTPTYAYYWEGGATVTWLDDAGSSYIVGTGTFSSAGTTTNVTRRSK